MRPSVRVPVAAAAICLAALVALLAAAYALAPAANADAAALHGLEALQGPVSWPLSSAIAHTADPLPLAVLVALLVCFGWRAGRRRQAVAAALAVGGANIATQLLKVALAHPRVHPLLGGQQVDSAAFPSGHATASMSIALAAVIVSPPRWRPPVAVAGTGYVLAVTSSILIMGWHFPSDVLGGLLVAAAFAFAAVASGRALAGRGSELTPARLLDFAPPRALWLGALGAVGLVLMAKAPQLVSFARLHTTGAAALAGIAAACAALLAGASLLADR